MCEYCKPVTNENTSEYLLWRNVKSELTNDISVCLHIWDDGKAADIDCVVGDLCEHVEIYYCPMCGRKLTDGREYRKKQTEMFKKALANSKGMKETK